jgi:LysM repeat protein
VKEKKMPAKTHENNQEPSRQGQTFYIVKPKDTVFAVMRKTGVHWQEIIKLNNLKAPKYTIFPGQNLRVK